MVGARRGWKGARMEDLGRVVVTRKAGLGTVLALGVLALAGLGLAAVILVNADWSQGVTEDVGMGLGFSLVFGLPAAAGCYASARRRFDIRERGLSVRKLFSRFDVPFTSLTAIAISRRTSNQKDLFSGKVDVGYLVTVLDDQDRAAAFDHHGYGLDESVEPLLAVMVQHVSQRLEQHHAAGQPVALAPGVTLEHGSVHFASKRRDVSIDDAEVRLQAGNGVVEVLRRDEHLATLQADGPNFEPARQLLAKVSAWRVF